MRTFFNTIENRFHDETTSHFLNSYFIWASFCFEMTVDCELFASVLHLNFTFYMEITLVTKQELFRFMKILCRWTKLITKLAFCSSFTPFLVAVPVCSSRHSVTLMVITADCWEIRFGVIVSFAF